MDQTVDLMSQNGSEQEGPSLRPSGFLRVPLTFAASEHTTACRFGREQRMRDHALAHHDVLHGVHIMKYPFMALASATLTKRARHILSQKVIAGTMKVHPPYVSDPKN